MKRAAFFCHHKNKAAAAEILHSMFHPQSTILTTTKLINNHLCNKSGIQTLLYQQGTVLDSADYASLVQGCISRKSLLESKIIHAHIIITGFRSRDIVMNNRIVTMYAKCGTLEDARKVFDEMPERNVVSWSAMIATYARHEHAEEALIFYRRMRNEGIEPNEFTFSSVLPACAGLASLEHGRQVHEDVIRSGYQSNVYVTSALVDMYVKCGNLEDARQVFDKMPERNVVSWNPLIVGYAQDGNVDEARRLFEEMPERSGVSWTAMIVGYAQNGHVDEAAELFRKIPQPTVISWTAMITGYAQNGRSDEALEVFWQMKLVGVKPDSDTFASVLSACANLAALEHGKGTHENIIKSGFQADVFVGSALVDMYAKCGSIENAHKMFENMPRRNVVSWTALIVGYAIHGWSKEALHLFEQMQRSDTTPDHVTFVGILSACCYAGLIDEGQQYFDSMSRDYHIMPSLEHCRCMVDLLGRAGHLNEAKEFIDKMPIKPDAAVWGCLLGACTIHANIVLGERVAESLFELDPKNAAYYVQLSNLYAAAGRWNDIEKVRKMMKDRKVEKMPGCSWIEVNNKVYSFLIGDGSHPHIERTYAELVKLSGKMKEAGYVPDTRYALHDVEEEQKEYVLRNHSEKLAIVFGLMNKSPGTPIRVVKNLRVCGDCHSATKFISQIVAREIIVRDSNRFHHFKDGQCSCRDYW